MELTTKEKIEEALEQIRPFLREDGGDITLLEIDGSTIKVEFLGACSSCSMSNMTLAAGVEEAIKKAVPQIEKVIAINSSEK